VTAARGHLAVKNDRPSPKGRLPLADWTVPVHYAHREVRFPGLRAEPATGDAELSLAQTRAAGSRGPDADLMPVGEFVGRDGLLYMLDTAARLQNVVVLHGSGGTGKTELAKAFGRWWRDTGGVDKPEWVV
jgi:hypothetical protein